jgi:hypothetical protein
MQIINFSISTGKAETKSGKTLRCNARSWGPKGPDPANKILENPADNYELFEKIKLGRAEHHLRP